MFNSIFKKKLKDLTPMEKSSIKVTIPLDSKYVKLESQAKEPNPLGDRYQDVVGLRLWINTDAPVSTFMDSDDDIFTKKISVIKTKGDVLDRYEIDPISYVTLQKHFSSVGDNYDNPKWFTSFNEISEKEMLNWTIARMKGAEIAEQEGQLVFLKPNEEILLQLADFSNITFEKVKPWTKDQKQKIDEALKKLYLKDEDVMKIKEWTLLDLLEKGKVKPKSETCGVILYGPAGTGKTVTVNESLKYIFKDVLDFKFVDIPIGNLVGGENSGIVGGFAKTLAGVYTKAFNYISMNRKPYVIFIDEGDDLIEDVSDKTDNGSTWLHQGQVILKNYMNPKRYPGVIFIISTNLPSPEKFYEPFRDQRLGVVHFPIPSFERFSSLFSDRNFPGSLQNKLLAGLSNVDLSADEINNLAHVCGSKMTLRIVANCCERYNKQFVSISKNFDFVHFKNYLIDYALAETDISKNKDLSKAEQKGDRQKYGEVTQHYSLLIRELDLLKRGVSADDDRILRAKEDSKNNVDLEKQYSDIRETLFHLVKLYNSESEKLIVNDEKLFLKPLKNILEQINLFNSSYVYDVLINSQNKNYLHEILPILTNLIIRIINKNEVAGDFTMFVQIINRLPETRVLFNSNENGESSIILTR
jgi:SpoVK/Ycf46/Vps4 family AAA+-type ATPase